MSAISAIYYRKHFSPDIHQHLKADLKQLNQAMSHHAKDGCGIWLSHQCGLAQQITNYHEHPLKKAPPYSNAQHQITLVAHCRLFNQNELKKKLQLPCDFSIHDHELILNAYLEWDLEFPNYLIGEFSILIWNEKRQQLLAVVDHFNSRPLYYYIDETQAIFASDIKALHCLQSVPRMPNFSKIARNDWLKFQMEPGETVFSNIYFVPAAHRLVIDSSQYFLQQYWRPSLKPSFSFRSNIDFREAFQEQFALAIQATTNSHLPVCLQLSGGLDSSAIALMYTKLNTSQPLFCFSNVLPKSQSESTMDEREYLDLIQSNQLVKESVIDEWRGPFDSLERCSENLYTSPQYYQHDALNDAARRHHAKIILHGTLGEITSSYTGYEYLAELFCHGRWFLLLNELLKHKKLSSRPGFRIFFNHVLSVFIPQWLKRSRHSNSRYKILKYSLIRSEFIAEFISTERLEFITEQFLQAGRLLSIDAQQNALAQLNWFMQHASHVFNQFDDAPKPAVYLSNPYFDKRFVEFCLRVPNQYRFQNGYPRSMVRIGMQNLLPEKIATRLSKTPFLPDYSDRYYRQLAIAKEAVHDLSTNALVQQVIDVKKLQQLIDVSSLSKEPNEHIDFLNYLIIPRTIYLAKFLSSF